MDVMPSTQESVMCATTAVELTNASATAAAAGRAIIVDTTETYTLTFSGGTQVAIPLTAGLVYPFAITKFTKGATGKLWNLY